jgi:hypothetical protein
MLAAIFPPMPPFPCRRFISLILLLASALCLGAQPVPMSTATVPTMNSSLDQFIASAKRQAETGSAEVKQLVAQLDPLKAKQQTLLATRRTKEAELARLRSSGADIKAITALQQEIDSCRSQLNAIDAQFQDLMSRIQPGPKPMPAGMLPASRGPVPTSGGLAPTSAGPVAVPTPTPGLLTRTVPSDKIKAAADALARNPAPSADVARSAATQILSTNQPGFNAAEVDQLARLIVDLASQSNAAALRAEIAAAKPANEKTPPPASPASNAIKFEVRVPSSGDQQSRLQELQARQTKLEQATLELMKKSVMPNMNGPAKQ